MLAEPPARHPRLTAARPDLAAAGLRGIVAAPRYAEGLARRVRDASAPLRREPRGDAPLDTEVLQGAPVTVFDEAEGWAWAQLADGYVGYLPSEALGPAEPAPTHRVATLATFVYPAPDLKRPPLARSTFGAALRVEEVEGQWARLGPGPGSGYVRADHLVPCNETEADFVAVAERFLGVPYLWGGRTTLGLDCSGLVQLALSACGIDAPRDADMQEGGLGAPLDRRRDGLHRGDLVFWRGHVGIMRDAAQFLHANGHHMLVVSEALAEAERRILAAGAGPVTGARRLPALGA